MHITGTNEDIRKALQDVNLPNLLLVLTCITKTDEWLQERYAPAPIEAPEGSMFPDDSGRYSEEIAAEIIEAAVTILGQVRDGQRELPAPPSQQEFQHMLSFSVVEPVDEGYAEMLMEETQFKNRDIQWQDDLSQAIAAGKGENFNVVIIGAGMSGLGTAAKLKQAGIKFTILEKKRRGRGHLVRKYLPRLWRRYPESLLLIFLQPQRQLVWLLLQTR